MKRYRDTRLSTDENLLSRLSPEDEFSFDVGAYEDEDEELAFTEDEDITDEIDEDIVEEEIDENTEE
jgi:hypothetical protein